MSAEVNPDGFLKEILTPFSLWFGELPRISRQMALRQIDAALLDPGSFAVWQELPDLHARLKLMLTREEKVTRLIFRREQEESRVVFHTHLAVHATQTHELENIPVQVDRWIFRAPRLLHGSRKGELVLNLGPLPEDRITIRNATGGIEKATVRTTSRDYTGEAWPILPVLQFTREIRRWLSNPRSDTVESVIRPPSQTDDTESWQVLRELRDGWTSIQRKLLEKQPWFIKDPPKPTNLWDQILDTAYVLRSYQADVELRVKADGTLAEKNQDETAQVRLEVSIDTEREETVATVTARPPDFLMDGAIAREVRTHFAEEFKANGQLARELGKHGLAGSEDDIRNFIRNSGNASVFRVMRRKSEDTELLVVEGNLRDRPFALVATGIFTFKDAAKTVVDSIDNPKLLHAGPITDAPALDRDDQKWFLMLAVAAERWAGSGILQ
jgi:hypothetical protein